MFCATLTPKSKSKEGAQLLSGRVLDLSLTGITVLCP